jgi:SNF2 family DNA or RNA helicase
MGLGKSVQAISIAWVHKSTWPLLIIVPASVCTATCVHGIHMPVVVV